VASLREELDALKCGGVGLDLAALRETFDGFLEQFEGAAIEALQSDELFREAAGDLHDELAGVAAGPQADDSLATVRARLDGWGKGERP